MVNFIQWKYLYSFPQTLWLTTHLSMMRPHTLRMCVGLHFCPLRQKPKVKPSLYMTILIRPSSHCWLHNWWYHWWGYPVVQSKHLLQKLWSEGWCRQSSHLLDCIHPEDSRNCLKKVALHFILISYIALMKQMWRKHLSHWSKNLCLLPLPQVSSWLHCYPRAEVQLKKRYTEDIWSSLKKSVLEECSTSSITLNTAQWILSSGYALQRESFSRWVCDYFDFNFFAFNYAINIIYYT